jgi:hypothetical protein
MLGDFGTVKMRTKWSFSTSTKSRCAAAGSLDDQGHKPTFEHFHQGLKYVYPKASIIALMGACHVSRYQCLPQLASHALVEA